MNQRNLQNFSIFSRLMKYIRNDDIKIRDDHVDVQFDQLRDTEQFQFPKSKELTDQPIIAKSHQDDIQKYVETQQEITDLERLRMMKLDQQLGTNTHFHEIENYEERLDSEHVMRRKILAVEELKKERQFQYQNVLNMDPQERIQKPPIVMERDYFKRLQDIVECPIIQKEDTQISKFGKTYLDSYKYLQLQLSQNEQNNEGCMGFIQKETMFSKLKFLRNVQIFDKLLEECSDRDQVFHQQPIYYDNYIYYQKDPNSGGLINNIYRSSNQLNGDQKEQEQLIFSQNEFIDILKKDDSIKYDLVIQSYLERLQDQQIIEPYVDMCFSHDHSWIGLAFDLTGENRIFMVILKQIDTKKSIIITNVDRNVAFIQNSQDIFVVHIEMSDLGIQQKLIQTNLKTMKQDIIFKIPTNKWVRSQQLHLIKQQMLLHVRERGQAQHEIYLIDTDLQCNMIFQSKTNQLILDNNKFHLFYAEKSKGQPIKQILSQPLFTLEQIDSNYKLQGEVIYQTQENDEIIEFCVTKSYLAMIIKNTINDQNEIKCTKKKYQSIFFTKDLNILNKKTKTLYIQEHQYCIESDYLQIKTQNNFNFVIECPYRPYQIIKFNMDMRSMDIIYQQQFAGFVQSQIISEQINIQVEQSIHKITIFYNKDKVYPQSTLLISLSDNPKKHLFNEQISLLDRGFIISIMEFKSIISSNFQLLISHLEKQFDLQKVIYLLIDKLKSSSLCTKVALHCNGPISGFTGFNLIKQKQQPIDIFIAHNGTYNALDLNENELLDIYPKKQQNNLVSYEQLIADLFNDQPYQLQEYSILNQNSKRIPSLKNSLFTCQTQNTNAGQTRQMVAQLRENKNNNSKALEDYCVNFIEYYDNQSEQEILLEHYTFLIASSYKLSK